MAHTPVVGPRGVNANCYEGHDEEKELSETNLSDLKEGGGSMFSP